MHYPYKNLIIAAFISSPIMSLSGLLQSLLKQKPDIEKLWQMYFFVTGIIIIIWGINLLLLTLLKNKKKYLFYIFSMILIGGVSALIAKTFQPPKPNNLHLIATIPPKISTLEKIFFPIISTISFNVVVIFIMELIINRHKEKHVMNEMTTLRLYQMEAQQIRLRQQIQPHFLFNSLNILKSLINQNHKLAEDYLIKLSSFLRASINIHQNDLISVNDELKLCIEYLEIQKIRFTDSLIYDIKIIDSDCLNKKIPTFSLQMLIENAIVHNALSQDHPLEIIIEIGNDNSVKITNNLQHKNSIENTTKIGLKNLTKRYQLLLKKEIIISKKEHTYEVVLPLN